MVSPTVYARRSLCHLLCDQPDAALRDAMQAQCVYPDWSTAFYMQAVALAKLDMHKDAADMLNEAAALEDRWQQCSRPGRQPAPDTATRMRDVGDGSWPPPVLSRGRAPRLSPTQRH